MRKAFWLLTIILATALAQPQLHAEINLSETPVANVTVYGESPLKINIPESAEIHGAEYANNTAFFNHSFSYSHPAGGMLSSSRDWDVFLFVFSQPIEFEYTVEATLSEGRYAESSAPAAAYSTGGKRITASWQGVANETQLSLRIGRPRAPQVTAIEKILPAGADAFLPGLVLAFLVGYFLAAGLATALLQKVRQITARMSESEKSIAHLLRNGPLEQSEIQRKLGLSKAHLSRTLRAMEERNIVEKTPKGKKNIVSLK